ncbi:hypothetical protein ACFQUU_21085 [Herbaspirillum sp. GCM10030257]|uniref:hypothetical protein n=1 Tax=Herbaspirillum sp. GCM10030257 TaxID=3273393 RepID=UPI0036173DC8
MDELKKASVSTALRYAVPGMALAAIGYVFDLGRSSNVLMMIGAAMLVAARLTQIMISAEEKKRKDS